MSDQTRSNELDLDENQAVQDLLGTAQNEAIEALDKDSLQSKKSDEGQSLVEEIEETEEKAQEVESELEEALNETEDFSEESTEEEKPRLSVVIAAYNGGPFIEEQLDSIYNQTLAVDELLIRDDGSKDNTVEVVQGWIEKHPDFNARLIVGEENLGYIGNFAELLNQATGDWIFLCDQDDRWHLDKVEKMVAASKEVPTAKLIASSFEFMNQEGEVYHLPLNEGWSNQNLIPWAVENPGGLNKVTKEQMLLHNYFQGCAMMIRKELGEDYDHRHDFHLPHDWFLALLASVSDDLWYLDLPLFDYRIHHSNTTGLPQAKKETKWLRFRRHYNRYYRTAVIRDMENVYSTIQRSIPELDCEDIRIRLEFCSEYLKRIDGKNEVYFRELKEHPGYTLCISEPEFELAAKFVKLSRFIKFPDKKI